MNYKKIKKGILLAVFTLGVISQQTIGVENYQEAALDLGKFWGTSCEYQGVVSAGGQQCADLYHCTKYRLWIDFGTEVEYQNVGPC